MSRRAYRAILSVLLLLLASCASLLAGEILLRMYYDSGSFILDNARKETRGIGAMPNARQIYVSDDELGYRPKHDGKIHTQFGCKPNDYPPDKQQARRTRLLFIGDSVTYRGKMVDALRSVYGERNYEYWNAGVDAFNTAQELMYYLRYNQYIEPDHVILTFHNNDFTTTPIAFFDGDNRIVRYFLRSPSQFPINSWLFVHSLFYRKAIDVVVGWKGSKRSDVIDVVKQSLSKLKEVITADGGKFTVVLLPILAARDTWKSNELKNHQMALEIFQELDIRYFDLSTPLQQALDKGIDPGQRPNDVWHPGEDVSNEFALYLAKENLFSVARKPE